MASGHILTHQFSPQVSDQVQAFPTPPRISCDVTTQHTITITEFKFFFPVLLATSTHPQIFLFLWYVKMEPLPGQKIRISSNCSNTPLYTSVNPLRGNTLCPLAPWGSELCACLFWPCYISSSHKHWQPQFTQRHAEERCKWLITLYGWLLVRERASARLLAKEHRAGNADSPCCCCWTCRGVPHHLFLVSTDTKKGFAQHCIAKVGYRWEQSLQLSAMPFLPYQTVSHHRLAKCLLVSALTGLPENSISTAWRQTCITYLPVIKVNLVKCWTSVICSIFNYIHGSSTSPF